jgi:hypothetical protein
LIGLLVELVSIFWSHAAAFLAFLLAGGGFLASGVLLFLYSLLAKNDSTVQMTRQ